MPLYIIDVSYMNKMIICNCIFMSHNNIGISGVFVRRGHFGNCVIALNNIRLRDLLMIGLLLFCGNCE